MLLVLLMNCFKNKINFYNVLNLTIHFLTLLFCMFLYIKYNNKYIKSCGVNKFILNTLFIIQVNFFFHHFYKATFYFSSVNFYIFEALKFYTLINKTFVNIFVIVHYMIRKAIYFFVLIHYL